MRHLLGLAIPTAWGMLAVILFHLTNAFLVARIEALFWIGRRNSAWIPIEENPVSQILEPV